MEINIPNGFIKVNNIEELLNSIDYKRDNFSNGTYYRFKYNDRIFAVEILKDSFYVDKKYIIQGDLWK
jgi:hypothetical protein